MKVKENGETIETVTDFIFLGSKIPADGDCSHEIKRRLLHEIKRCKKSYDQHAAAKSLQSCLNLFLLQIGYLGWS